MEKWRAPRGLNLPLSANNERLTGTASQIASQKSGVPADLRLVIDSRPRLSEPLKAAVLAIVNTTTKKEGQ
jgi:hypothetical protein